MAAECRAILSIIHLSALRHPGFTPLDQEGSSSLACKMAVTETLAEEPMLGLQPGTTCKNPVPSLAARS